MDVKHIFGPGKKIITVTGGKCHCLRSLIHAKSTKYETYEKYELYSEKYLIVDGSASIGENLCVFCIVNQ